MTQKVLIYGSTVGIGSTLSWLLYVCGYNLHLVGRNESKLSALAAELGCGYTCGDIPDNGFLKRVTEDTGEMLDGMVYAVGNINLRSLARFTEEEFLQNFRVNALGAALAVQAAR